MNAEQYLAAALRQWLTEEGWEIYQEVEIPGGRTDLVAVRGPIRWGIEVKTTLSMGVFDQAHHNTRWFHHSSIAVPAGKDGYCFGRNWDFARKCSQTFGFGILALANYPGTTDYRVLQQTRPQLNRRVGTVHLYEEQKTYCAAGSSTGGHWTPFRRTVQQLVAYVQRTPGCLLREVVKELDHHYSNAPSATRCLAEMIRSEVIKELRLDNGKLYLLTPAPPAAS